MKHESLMLQGLFATCLLVCSLVLGSMLTVHPIPPQPAGTGATHALVASTTPCVASGRGAACPMPRG